MEALSDFEPKPLLEGWEGHRPNDQRGREHGRKAGDSRCRRGQEANVSIPQRPAQNVEEGMGHRLNANYNAKEVVDVVHVTEVDPPAEDGVAKEIVEVVSLTQKHHHVERIVEEGRRTGEGQKGHVETGIGADGGAGTNAHGHATLASVGEGLLGDLGRWLSHAEWGWEHNLQKADDQANDAEDENGMPPLRLGLLVGVPVGESDAQWVSRNLGLFLLRRI